MTLPSDHGSSSQLSKAESASDGNITYLQADIQDLPKVLDAKYKGAFDAVFTSAVLHWTKRDPRGVVEGISWLLKPGGRFVFEFGGFGNTSVHHLPPDADLSRTY